MKYRRRRNEKKTVIHWGQRKLFMSELSFFTQFAKSGYTVVYAGAAPGTHTAYLIELFPDLNFVLVDPAPFSKKLVESDRVTLRQELFTDDIAREFVDFDVRWPFCIFSILKLWQRDYASICGLVFVEGCMFVTKYLQEGMVIL